VPDCTGCATRRVRRPRSSTDQRTARTVSARSTAECARNVQVILDHVYTILDSYPDAELAVEHRVHIPSQAVPDRMWGTTDVRIYVPSIRWLFVIDYKHGAGIFVDRRPTTSN
jgi:hypothetical protein